MGVGWTRDVLLTKSQDRTSVLRALCQALDCSWRGHVGATSRLFSGLGVALGSKNTSTEP